MNTLRMKILFFFIAYLSFMALNMGMYWWNIDSFRERLTVMDEFHDLLSDILETRRYEKNFMFYPEPGSFKEALIYLDKTQETVGVLHENIIKIGGQRIYESFTKDIGEYRNHLRALAEGSKSEVAETRRLGSSMVQLAQELISLKKASIHNALDRILFVPMAAMLSLAVLITVLFAWQAKKVLGRLAYVQQAAEGVAKGDYDAIQHISSDDAISLMMRQAFSNMAAEIESRQDQLIESRKLVSIGTLTSGIAHELNNPLNNISLTADTLLEEFEELQDVDAKEMLLDIINEVGRASDVVSNLLDFSREGQHPMARLSVKTIISQTLKLVRNQLMMDEIKLVVDIPEDLPEVRGDLHYLEQVFINLFINADHAMHNGGTLAISARQASDTLVCVDVRDTGCGMTAETLERIFDPFFTTKPVGKGTGLGLSIIYGIIHKHGGFIEVQSEIGHGTTFSINLLIEPEQEEA